MTFHALRHSTASMLFELGWHPKEIQEWLEHADFYTTMNIYTHIQKYHNRENAERLTGMLKPHGTISEEEVLEQVLERADILLVFGVKDNQSKTGSVKVLLSIGEFLRCRE